MLHSMIHMARGLSTCYIGSLVLKVPSVLPSVCVVSEVIGGCCGGREADGRNVGSG